MAKQTKLKFKPTPISRLSKYTAPLKMVGDPPWSNPGDKRAWQSREKAVYPYMMELKNWPMPWSPDLWETAQIDNRRIDYLLGRKWIMDYPPALIDNYNYDYEAAIRENAIWDYHHDNYIAA
jgi:hypothetical protein